MDKKKILSSLALAGILTASALGANVNAATEGEYLKPVGVYKKMIEGEVVVPYILKERKTPLTVRDIQCEFANLEFVNGIVMTDSNATMKTGDTFTANGIKHTVVIYGDVNKDGIVSTADASLIQRIRLNKEKDVEPVQLEAADVYNEGKISTADASRVQRYVVNKPDCAVIIDPMPGIEDETAPVISGVTNGDKIVIKLNDSTFTAPEATAIDDYDGKVQVSVDNNVNVAEEGEYQIVYTAKDRAGNVATATLTVVVDNQGPVMNGLPEENKIYVKRNDEFVAPDINAIDAVEGEVEIKSIVIKDSEGEVVSEIDTTQDGEYTLTYTAEDSLGNETIETITVIVDGVAPVVDVTYSPSAEVVTNGNVTVTITANDEPIQEVEGWQLSEDRKTLTKEYQENVTAEEVIIKDLAGNETKKEITILNIDKEPPVVNGFTEGKSSYKAVIPTYNSDEVFIATLQKDGEEPQEYVSNTTIGNADGGEDGEYVLMVRDVAGNETKKEFTIDNVAPEITTTEEESKRFKNGDTIELIVTANDEVDGEITPTLAITNSDGETVEYIADIDTTQDGEYTFTYSAQDEAGNTATPVTRTVIVDATPAELISLIPSTKNITTEVTIRVEFNEPMQAQAGWVAESETAFTKKYTTKTQGTETVQFKDLAGNITSVDFAIDNIDDVELMGRVTYSPADKETPTQLVVATISAEKELKELEGLVQSGWVLAEDKKSMKKPYTNNVTEEVTIEDLAGHTNTVQVKIENIDRTAPTVTVSYSNEDPDNAGQTLPTAENVEVTIRANEPLQKVDGWTVSDDKTSMTKIYEENTTAAPFKVKDIAGNESADITIEVTNIDKDAPTVTGLVEGKNSYTRVDLTFTDANGVIATLQKEGEEPTPVQSTGLTLGDNEADEGTYILVVKDNLGNEKTYSFTIDMTPIEIEGVINGGRYKSVAPTFEDGLGTLKTLDDSDQAIKTEPYTSGTPITIDGNYELTVKDAAGNTETVRFVIDNVKPEFTNIVENQTFNGTEVPVIPTINEEMKEVSLTKNGNIVGSYTQLGTINADSNYELGNITDDGNYILTVTDKAGNTATVNFTIDTIVKGVKCITSNDGNPINVDVIVTITAEEELQEVEDWTLSSDKKTMTRTYAQNTGSEVTVIVKDLVGNEETVTFEVEGIDKVPLTGTATYSNTNPADSTQTLPVKKVTVTITAGKEVKELAGWTLSADKLSMEKEYEADTTESVTIEDLAGNTCIVPVNVTNVYNTRPVIEITGGLPEEITTMTKTEGAKVKLPNVTAIDAKGATLSVAITINKIVNGTTTVMPSNTTEVDISTACIYSITYTATDAAGNEKTATRTVIVQ